MRWFRTSYINQLQVFVLIGLLALLFSCNSSETWKLYSDQKGYLNLNDSVEYMGMEVCKECHFEIYQTFLRTGMGFSFDSATRNKSMAVIGEDSILYDPYNNFYYKPYWANDSLYVKEFRVEDSSEVFSRTEKISWIIGSGQHTNSHLYMSRGYLFQAPFTYYTQDNNKFDFPPGFEEGNNSRFTRKIGLECMSCHNGFPDFVLGSENKYNHIPDGIDCERCHGPGEIHVKLKKSGFLIDTAKYIDYSIVNPAKLSPELQIDLCARCHLQGTMVLKPEKSFYDYKPGMSLTEVMDIFMPVFEGGKEDFIMASHFERLSQSECYINSNKEFSCNNCHNPHISVKETNRKRYNKVCQDCHQQNTDCSLPETERMKENNNCFICHMRESTSRDIPHVKIHDHKITIPPTKEKLAEKRIFIGMAIINETTPDSLTMARGYLQEYETYHPDPNYLDSAYKYLQLKHPSDTNYYINTLVNLYFLQKDYSSIISFVEKMGVRDLLSDYLNKQDYSNYDGWTSYRIGQAFESKGSFLVANSYYENAVQLAPYNLEFQTKYGGLLVNMNKLVQAKKVFEFIISEDPNYTSAYVNLGFIHLNQREIQRAEDMFNKALKLNPDNIQALINLASIYVYKSDDGKAEDMIERIEQIEPKNKIIYKLKSQLK